MLDDEREDKVHCAEELGTFASRQLTRAARIYIEALLDLAHDKTQYKSEKPISGHVKKRPSLCQEQYLLSKGLQISI